LDGGYRQNKYFPFSTSSDIIDQFNYIGFLDVCIYPGGNQLSLYKDPDDPATKGIRYVFGGFIQNNQTGKEYYFQIRYTLVKLYFTKFIWWSYKLC